MLLDDGADMSTHFLAASTRTAAIVIAAVQLGTLGCAQSNRAEGPVGTPRGPDTLIHEGTLPPGYRDWRLISVAHEDAPLNDLRAILGNDVAIEAYRDGKATYPDGSVIARLAWKYLPSEENNKVFGHAQSFVAGPPVNVQFMVKDSRKYAATGGWEFAQFDDGKPVVDKAILEGCFDCHALLPNRDLVFTHYAP